jgi:hypothetical protein
MKTCRRRALFLPWLCALVVATACNGQVAGTAGPPGGSDATAGSGGAEAATGGAGGSKTAGSGGANTADGAAGETPSADAPAASGCATTATEFCDDFEAGSLDLQKWKPNKSNSASASITVDDVHAHGGKYAVHIKVIPNRQSTALIDTAVNFPMKPNAFYARMFVYFSPDIPAATGANPDMHSGFLLGNGNNDHGTVQAGLGLSGFNSNKQWLSYSIFYANPKFEFGPSSKSMIAANQWQCVELFEDGSDPKTEIRQIWVDDKELPELRTDSAKAAGGNPNHLPPTWASVSFGIWEYHPIPTLSDIWIDDVRISNKKIGCEN